MSGIRSSRATECQFLVFGCCTKRTCVEVMAMTCESLGVSFCPVFAMASSLITVAPCFIGEMRSDARIRFEVELEFVAERWQE